MSDENVHSIKLRTRLMNQHSASPKCKRGRSRKAGNEMAKPKRTRVGRDSRRKACFLDSSLVDFESSYSAEQVQMNASGAGTVFNVEEIKKTLRGIGESFVKWIIEGVQAVPRETVLEASRRIQTITSLLRKRKASSIKARSARQRERVYLITPLMESAAYLTMVIDNYLQNIVQKEQEGNGHDLSFADMFQDDIDDTENMSFSEQDSTAVKSILKTSKKDCDVTRKRISFAEKATEVYQDKETSQISLAKCSTSANSLEGNATATTTATGNSEISDRTCLFRPPSNVTTPKRMEQEVVLMNETSLADESPSIIESSFLNDSVSSGQANYTKNFKKFKTKMRNEKEIQDPICDNKGSKFNTVDTFNTIQTNLEINKANVEGIELDNTDHPNTYDSPSNIFLGEMVKTFMSHITGNSAEENIPKLSENVPPFHDFVLTLPDSSTSEESLDVSVRMAVNIAKGSAPNPKVGSPRNDEVSRIENKSEWIWGPENSTEIIPSSEQFSKDATCWMETHWENVKDDYHAISDNSSLNVSLLFDETNEASWIPGTFNLQNDFNIYTDEPKIITKQIPPENGQGSTKYKTKYEANALQVSVGLQNAPQGHDRQLCEPQNNKKLDESSDGDGVLNRAPKAIKVPDLFDAIKRSNRGKEQGLETSTTYRRPLESGQTGEPSENPSTADQNFLADSSNVLKSDSKYCSFGRSNNVMPDEPKRKLNLLKEPSFYSPTQSKYIFDNKQPILSFGALNKLPSEQELKRTLGNNGTKREEKELNDTKSHEPKTQQCHNKNVLKEPLFHPLTQNNNVYNNQQPSPLFSESKHVHLEMELMKTRDDIDKIVSHKPNPENCLKKHILKEPLLHLLTHKPPIEHSKQEMELKKSSSLTNLSFSASTLTEPVKDKNLDFKHVLPMELSDNQETTKTQASGWDLMNMDSLGRDTSVCPKENLGTAFGESFESGTIPMQNRSLFATRNVDYQNNYLGNSLFTGNLFNNQFQPSIFPAYTTLDETELVKTTSKANQSSILTNKDEGKYRLEKNKVLCAAALSSQSRGDGGMECSNYSSKLVQPHQKSVRQHGPNLNALINQSGSKENRSAGSRHEQQSGEQHTSSTSCTPLDDTSLQFVEATSSTENTNWLSNNTQVKETKENRLNISCKKLQKSRPNKKASTSKRNVSMNENSAKNDFIHETNTLEKPVIDSQKPSQRKPKTTRKKPPIRRTKFAPIPEQSQESNKETASNAQNVGLMLNKSQPSVIQKGTPSSDGRSIRYGSSNPTNIGDPSKEVFLRPFNVKRNRKKQQNSTSAVMNHPKRELSALADNIASAAVGLWADLRHDNFNFFNPNPSKNEEDNLYSYQSRVVNVEKPPSNIDVESSALHSNQEQNCKETDCAAPGSQMHFMECDNLSWDEFPDGINADGSFSCRDSMSNMPREESGPENVTQANTRDGNTMEYQSLTQLSWEQSATCEIPTVSSQHTPICEIGDAGYGQIEDVTIQPANNDSVIKQPFTPGVTVETNQLLSFTEFMQAIGVSSTENVLDSAPLSQKKSKTVEEEIEEILNGIEFVRVPAECELFEATNIEELNAYINSTL